MPVRLVRRRACPDSRKAEEMWRSELGKITVTMMNQEETVSFYTALYHAFLSPTVYMDTDRN